ncbi:uncharacterized protein DUF4259 [Pedobacter psychrotolerans]|uniref:Uncharacterized protein DUF4259 n=1 Tax=Pedobacter psychrotolerans TaxID=1843235 RepID=A0A4R2HGF3_9SPHI|nr:DUF4259 domain-containing protein [Pedobacter psychrotolerans]TCO25410.1 uncharacterized protein DUF4259 [Pedobacter psychrotolerans]GGE45635.1 hypothetical protein GCM10011413_09760 [Pedobacter psychrotolerans]
MGAWGIKNFENDTACDWLVDFENNSDIKILEDIFNQILEEKEFIDDEESFITLAFLELIAIKFKLIETELEVNIHFTLSYGLIEKVLLASEKIVFFEDHSELRELWIESDDYEQWKNYQLFLIKSVRDYSSNHNIQSSKETLFSKDTNFRLPPDWNKS